MGDDQSRKRELPGLPDARPPRYGWIIDKSPDQIARETLERRIAEEKAHYERGFPVAGHDFRHEHEERERER